MSSTVRIPRSMRSNERGLPAAKRRISPRCMPRPKLRGRRSHRSPRQHRLFYQQLTVRRPGKCHHSTAQPRFHHVPIHYSHSPHPCCRFCHHNPDMAGHSKAAISEGSACTGPSISGTAFLGFQQQGHACLHPACGQCRSDRGTAGSDHSGIHRASDRASKTPAGFEFKIGSLHHKG